MYPVDLLVIGRLRLEPCRALEKHYLDMLRSQARINLIELPEGKGDAARQLRDEADRLRPKLKAAGLAILLTPEGRRMDSEGFAAWLGERMDQGQRPAFAIGSSHGFDPALKAEVREQISLSPMTFPHELFRVMFLEQLYRAFTILKGTPYHK
ncbi:MAG TPA: 23S rRNA (pseudouridine(1915)-N(3))-methyltransferase RlmH [Holophagaceae bacterium]|nr:23S rRNA (pseudouridine(1915)-N(3))-methyltransferase RlmH [Holophagaceae bacterium]